MKKLFEILVKPSKWIFIVCAAIIAVAFAITKAKLIGSANGFVPVVSALVVMLVGTLLLLASPVLLLMKKENEAKMVFLLLLVYWLIWYTQRNFEIASTYPADNALSTLAVIFSFLVALCLTAVLVLTVLEFALKKQSLRYFSAFVLFFALAFGFFASLFFFICGIRVGSIWEMTLQNILIVLGYTFAVFFGYIYFFGVPKRAND